jgi:hypothetical protein
MPQISLRPEAALPKIGVTPRDLEKLEPINFLKRNRSVPPLWQ